MTTTIDGDAESRGHGRRLAWLAAVAIAVLASPAAGWAAPRPDPVGVVTVNPAAVTAAGLRSAYAAGAGVPVADVGAIRPGSLHVASAGASGAGWAAAAFLPAPRSPGPTAWSFQGGRGLGVFTRPRRGSWRLVSLGGRALACVRGLPAPVRRAWRLAPASTCSAHRSTPAAARAAARRHRHGSVGARVAAVALTQVGVKGTPVAHDFSLDCNPYTPLLGPTTPNSDGCGYEPSFAVQDRNETWCADFVKWAWERAGVTDNLNTINAGAVSFYGWGRGANERMPTDSTDPHVGDAVVFFPRGSISANGFADHVGIIASLNANGTIDMVNGDFLDPRTRTVSVEYDTNLDLATWAPSLWGKGEQWVFVSPPRASAHPAPTITSLTGPSRAVTSTAVGFHARAIQPGGSTVGYVWSFGDGGSALGARVTHVFRSPGPQTVTVTATSNLHTARSRHLDIQVVADSSTVANTADGAEYYTTQPVRQQLFGLSARGALTEQRSITGGSWIVRTLPGAPSARSSVTALNYPDSSYRMTQHVYFRGADGVLTQTSGSAWSWRTARVGGRLGAASPIVAALTDAGRRLVPRVFSVSSRGRLLEAVGNSSGWSLRTLPGTPSPTTSLAVTDLVRGGAVQVHLFYLDRRGRLRADVRAGDRWRPTSVTGAARPAADTSLAAAAFGTDGGVVHVFYLDRAGALVDARSGGRGWSSRVLPGAPAPSSPLLAQTYLPTSVTAAHSPLSLGVFYLTGNGTPATTSYAPTTSSRPRWVAATLGGTGDALLGASAYPDGVQGQQLFYRSGTGVYDNAYTPVDGGWYPARMPGTAARSPR